MQACQQGCGEALKTSNISSMTNLLPTAYVVANPDLLSITLIKELLDKSCRVIVVSNHRTEFAKYFSKGENLIFKDFREKIDEPPSYLFLIQGFSPLGSFFSKKQIKLVLNFSQTYLPKTEVILPYVVTNETRKEVEFIATSAKKIGNRNLEILYLGDIYGVGMNLVSGSWISSIFRNLWRSEPLLIPAYDFDFYSIDVITAVKHMIKGIFSYGFPEKENIIAIKKRAFTCLREIQNITPLVSFISDTNITAPATISNFNFLPIEERKEALSDTLTWIMKNRNAEKEQEVKQIEVKKNTLPNLVITNLHKKIIKRVGILALIGVWILMMPFLLLLISTLTLKTGFYDLSIGNIKDAELYFNLSRDISRVSNETILFDEGKRVATVVTGFSIVGNKSVHLFSLFNNFVGKVQGSEDYDISSVSQQMYLDLDDIYKQISFLTADIKTESSIKTFLPQLDLATLRLYLDNVRGIAANLPQLLGSEKPVNYLLLSQDNHELRPTGGLISSFGIFTFDKGRLSQKVFMDTKSADVQLKGHVEPPNAIKRYLGENNWYLRDSNWDPDFRLTAPKVEWFLENEINQPVDGVIAVDAELFNSLQGGGVETPNCTGNCLPVWLASVEANLGINKVNANIQRSINLLVNLTGNVTQERLDINYKNSSDKDAYRNYLRVLAPSGSNFEKVTENMNGVTETISPEITQTQGRTEVGVLVQIPARQSITVTFIWSNKNSVDYNKPGKIMFYLRKQPGVSDTSTSIRFILPNFLTRSSLSRYNTDLTSDFKKEFDW